jgi:hypothetical protein
MSLPESVRVHILHQNVGGYKCGEIVPAAVFADDVWRLVSINAVGWYDCVPPTSSVAEEPAGDLGSRVAALEEEVKSVAKKKTPASAADIAQLKAAVAAMQEELDLLAKQVEAIRESVGLTKPEDTQPIEK